MASLAELAVQGIVSVCGGAALATTVNAYFSRRTTRAGVAQTHAETGRTEAEITSVGAGAVDVQVNTSLDILREMRIDLERVRTEARQAREDAATTRLEVDKLRDWRHRQETLNAAHGAWDADVTARLAAAGINVPPPPPLHADL